jgi:hypothetical protein
MMKVSANLSHSSYLPVSDLSIEPVLLDGESEGLGPVRREKREAVIRVVEYSVFPRRRPDQKRRVAFTRNQSTSGMCLVTQSLEAVGSLLRVGVRDVDGRASLTALARVMWSDAGPDGRYFMGLHLEDPCQAAA